MKTVYKYVLRFSFYALVLFFVKVESSQIFELEEIKSYIFNEKVNNEETKKKIEPLVSELWQKGGRTLLCRMHKLASSIETEMGIQFKLEFDTNLGEDAGFDNDFFIKEKWMVATIYTDSLDHSENKYCRVCVANGSTPQLLPLLYNWEIPNYIVLGHELTHFVLRLEHIYENRSNPLIKEKLEMMDISLYTEDFLKWVKFEKLPRSISSNLREYEKIIQAYWEKSDEIITILGYKIPEGGYNDSYIGERFLLRDHLPYSHCHFGFFTRGFGKMDLWCEGNCKLIKTVIREEIPLLRSLNSYRIDLNTKDFVKMVDKRTKDVIKGSDLDWSEGIGTPHIEELTWKFIDVPSDGNCGFWAILEQLQDGRDYSNDRQGMKKLRMDAAKEARLELVDNSIFERIEKPGSWLAIEDFQYISQVLKKPITIITDINGALNYHSFRLDDGGESGLIRGRDNIGNQLDMEYLRNKETIFVYYIEKEGTGLQHAVRHYQAIVKK